LREIFPFSGALITLIAIRFRDAHGARDYPRRRLINAHGRLGNVTKCLQSRVRVLAEVGAARTDENDQLLHCRGSEKKKSAYRSDIAALLTAETVQRGENSLRRMTVGSDFIGDRRFRLVITISNAHLCPPGARRSFSTSDSSFPCTGWSVWGPGRRMAVGQVWALLFSLPVSISHLLACSRARDASRSDPKGGGEIRLRVHVRVYSHSNQLRRLLSSGLSTRVSPLRASTDAPASPPGPGPLPPLLPLGHYYFSTFLSRRIYRAGDSSAQNSPRGKVSAPPLSFRGQPPTRDILQRCSTILPANEPSSIHCFTVPFISGELDLPRF